jgi:DNA-binding LacI/PurR family transcriptional regulator
MSSVSEIPIVCIDRLPPDWEGDSVTVENFEGGYKAGRYLTLLGHRTICIIRGPFNVVTANDRVRGFQKALREKGVDLPPENIHEGVFTQ